MGRTFNRRRVQTFFKHSEIDKIYKDALSKNLVPAGLTGHSRVEALRDRNLLATPRQVVRDYKDHQRSISRMRDE